jgi:fatty acid amide hydrolase 2
MNELLKSSALELAAIIKKKQASPSEVLEAHIARIEEVNPKLNALVEQDYARARETAEAQTEILAKSTEDLPPFFGVPMTVKEMFAYEGLRRTGGSIHHRQDVSDFDATILARLRMAGAIPMGTTNVPELGFWFETNNPVYGRTNNPYNTSRTCGGSSGGEGALIGAGASPMGIGSDIGGSIRMPAFFCGIPGHKPSRKFLPLTGHFPYPQNGFADVADGKYPFTSSGPMARKVMDLYAMMNVMMGSDPHDPATLDLQLEEPSQEWAGRKILICPSPSFHLARNTDNELAQIVKNCGKLFEELGAEVEELDPRFFVRATELWFAALKSTRTQKFHEKLTAGTGFSFQNELFKFLVGKGDYTLPNIFVAASELFSLKDKDIGKEMAALEQMKNELSEKLGPEGLLLLPPHPRVAPKHNAPLWSPFDFIYTAIFTTTGHPATVVPTGLNAEGLPLGIQIVGPYGKDHLTLSCADFLETTFGGWQPPTNI